MTRAGYNFASISVGPGNERAAAVAYAIIGSGDRDFVDQISYKGSSYRIGDYVHLTNPDDASKPIVGQICRLFVPHGSVDYVLSYLALRTEAHRFY
jgi:chromatin structure-remodeling complex subunit RSC1/2